MNQPVTKEEQVEIRGLCANCNNRRTCINFRTRGAVWHCNEHDTYHSKPTAVVEPLGNAVGGLSTQPTASAAQADGFKGLCINCDNRQTCRLPKSDHGVWHCEEYR